MTNYVRMTLEEFCSRLAAGYYASSTAARRGVCKLDLSAKEKKDTQRRINEHFVSKSTVASVGKKQDDAAPDLSTLRAAVKAFMEATKSGLGDTAELCGVNIKTLRSFMTTERCDTKTLLLIQKNLRKLNALPKKLAKEELINLSSYPAASPKAAPVKKVLIAPVVISTVDEMELDRRELALIDRMRQRLAPPPTHLNGVSGKYSKSKS